MVIAHGFYVSSMLSTISFYANFKFNPSDHRIMTSSEQCRCIGGGRSDDEILCEKCVQERNKSDDTQSNIPATSPRDLPDAAAMESSGAMGQGKEPKECHTDDGSA